MASSTIIIDYLGEGLLAARPAAPALPTGGIGLYYATDNGNTYLYDVAGATWILLASSGSAVTARSVTAIGNTTGGTSSTTGPQSAMTYSGAGAVSVGFTNGTLIVSSPATVASATSMGRTYTGNTGGDSSSSTQPITAQTLSGAGIVTVGVSGGTQFISASSAASATNQNITLLGNTNQATSSFADTLTGRSLSATGALSAGFDTNGVLILSVPAAGASGTANSEVALGNTTGATSSTVQTLGSLSVSGAGNVSVGFSTTAAGAGVMIISGAAGGASGTANSEFALGNTTGATSSTVQTLQSLSVSGAGGVSVGFSTTAANQGVLIVSGATTAASGTAENMVAIGNTFGATSSSVLTLTAMTVSATGGISAGFSTTAAGAGVLELSVAPPIASATAQNITLLGNTNQATSSFADTITGRSISATGGLSAGFDTNGVLILSGGAGGAGSTSESVFALGNTTGATSSATQALSGVSFSGAGGVSVGFTTTGAGANVLQISGAGGNTISFYNNGIGAYSSNTVTSFMSNLVIINPISPAGALLVNQFRAPIRFNANPAYYISDTASSAASRSISCTASAATSVNIYSASAIEAWSIYTSGSAGMSLTATLSESGTTWNQAWTLNFQLGSTTSSTTWTASTLSANPDGAWTAAVSSFFLQAREMVVPIPSATLAQGKQWLVGLWSSSGAAGSTGAGAGTTRFTAPTFVAVSLFPCLPGAFSSYLPMGQNTTSAGGTAPPAYVGFISTSKTSTIAASDLTAIGPLMQSINFSLGSFTN